MNNFLNTINIFCAELGMNRMLVQGAGGNVSLKSGDTLWVKGSGTWLSDAAQENIFVPVGLNKITTAIMQGNFQTKPEVIGNNKLNPSIETILHALMPHRIVVHLHAIRPLRYLVRDNCQPSIENLLKTKGLSAVFIDYHKPGPMLAKAISRGLKHIKAANIFLLKNHGIVVGADSIIEMRALLNSLDSAFPDLPNASTEIYRPILPPNIKQYKAFDDLEVQELAFKPSLYNRLNFDWVLFPDHAIFLGDKAFAYDSWEDFLEKNFEEPPDLIFIKNKGVFTSHSFSAAKIAQLRCYYDVISSIPNDVKLNSLSAEQISDLLNWDAEKLRQQMVK